MSVQTSTPAANLLTRSNIVHPQSSREAKVLADEAAARLEIADRLGVTSVSGGTIERGT